MQLHQTLHDVTSGNALKKTNFSISLNAKTAQLLNDPYTDKIMAVVREISCNAIDANKSGGNPASIRIHLPNALEPWFKVSDDGTGMGPDMMQENYTSYGTSTKDNDNDSIGAFGIGRFSALSYGESFSIVDRHRPTNSKCFYTVTKNEEGIPELLLNHRETLKDGESSGFEVTVPVKREDFLAFKERAEQFFVNVSPLPAVTGNALRLVPPEVALQSTTGRWRVLKNGDGYGSKCFAVMGPVRYLVDIGQIPSAKRYSYQLNYTSLELFFNMGEVMTTISRESISYTPATVKALDQAMTEFLADLRKAVEAKIATATTMYEARCAINEAFESSQLRALAGNKFTWKGQELETGPITVRGDGGSTFAHISTYKVKADRMSITFETTMGITPSRNGVAFVVDDLETVKPRPALRDVIKLNFGGGGRDVLIIRPASPTELTLIIKALGDPSYTHLAQMQHPDRTTGGLSARAPKKPVLMKLWAGYSWDEIKRSTDEGGEYVPLFGNETKSAYGHTIGSIRNLMKEVTDQDEPDLYGIPATVCAADKMKEFTNWELWDTQVKRRFFAHLKATPDIRKHYSAFLDYQQQAGDEMVEIAENLPIEVIQQLKPRSPFVKMRAVIDEFKKLKLQTLQNLAGHLQVDMKSPPKKSFSFKEAIDKARKQCPLLDSVQRHDAVKDTYRQGVVDYINSNS